ncbi:hypothetical protein DVH24_008300 [Malus domestica]|uniref:Uncharacterized protein n=1 Tax=Malus domestica TaxID=3750 RepID=A0A498JJS2_MALDO|nr:hypothetical protein DVH24_008300 [Malus domestica]
MIVSSTPYLQTSLHPIPFHSLSKFQLANWLIGYPHTANPRPPQSPLHDHHLKVIFVITMTIPIWMMLLQTSTSSTTAECKDTWDCGPVCRDMGILNPNAIKCVVPNQAGGSGKRCCCLPPTEPN